VKISRLFGAAFAVVGITLSLAAKAEPPSFGRLVYGASNGTIVLPQNAWLGNDTNYGGGVAFDYGPDTFGSIGYGQALINSGAGGNGAFGNNGAAGVFGSATGLDTNVDGPAGGGTFPGVSSAATLSVGKIAGFGANTSLKYYTPNNTATLFNVNLNGTTNVTNPFAFAIKNTVNAGGFTFYQQDAANPVGSKQAKIYKDTFDTYWIGFEDIALNNGSDADYNDFVFSAVLTPIPEPAFYQMAGLLIAGGVGFVRLRRRKKSV